MAVNQQQYYNSGSSTSTSSSTSSSNTNDDGLTYLSDIQNRSTVRVGPFGIDPLGYTEFVIGCLILWIFYLFIPRGLRFSYCGSYPKRYAWSDRIKRRRRQRSLPQHHPQQQQQQQQLNVMNSGNSVVSMNTVETSSTMNTNHRELSTLGIGTSTDVTNGMYADDRKTIMPSIKGTQPFIQRRPQSLPEEEVVDFSSPPPSAMMNPHTPFSSAAASTFNDEIAISTTMQQLRDNGIQIIAHGSRGKPKKVRLVLTENAIEWRTESKRKNKVGKMHQVPLTHIMYVDVGKATTALRRVENAAIPENVCLSLLTKDGSLDLEASSSLERDALVNCFSLVLDEVHAQNWRDVYRAPSSDMPSSFDEYDMMVGGVGARMEV